jgi:hydroxyacylglutathione hydrolase
MPNEEAEVSIYDPYTQIFFTGDLLYPGRLYIRDWEAFKNSINRMIEFAETYPITHLLGCHVEMSIYPRLDYLIRCSYQPHERPLQMTVEQLYSVREAILQINGASGIHTFDDYIIYNGIPDRYFSYENIDPKASPGDLRPL